MGKDELTAWTEHVQQVVLDEARERYSERAITHWKTPHNFRASPIGCVSGRLTGPCGDTIEIWLEVVDGGIARAGFLTDGCCSSIMCGSAAAWLVEGLSIPEVQGVTQQHILAELGGLPELERHCALLSFLVLAEALHSLQNAGER